MMTLALLITAATSAWAESKPIGLNVEYAAGDVITTNSTGDVYVWWGIYSTGGENYEWVIKITSSVTPTISKLGIDESSGFITLDNDYAVYNMNGNIEANSYKIQCQGKVTGTTLEKVYVASGSGTLTDPYVFAPGPAASAATTVPLNWDAATPNTATLTNGMPAGNVTVSVEYFPQAEFAKSTDETLAPTAIPDVPANTDAPIVTPGTVANIGTSEVKQGTLMYYVKQATGNTDPEAPTYDTKGWTDKVPTADGLAQGDAYVWYYIKGAEPAQGTARTDDNTRSDSDIKPLGTDGIVTLAAEPTYDVEFAEGVNPEPPAEPEWTATPNTGVKKGTEVTVTYSGSKKVIGVKAEKKKAPAETTVTLTTGEIGDLFSWDSNSKTINGITIAVSGDACFHSTGLIDVHGDTGPEPDPDQVYAVGTFTFTSSAGKIKRIDINHNNGGLWYGAGEGWPGSYQVYDNSTFTWSGIPAASVTLNGSHKGFENCALSDVSSIVFTIEPTN